MSLKDHQNISKKYYHLFIHKSTFVKLTFISIACVHFLLPVLFRIEHENSCNDPLEIPWTVMRLAVNCPCFPMFQEITTITRALSQSFHPWFISCDCLWWKYLQSCHTHQQARGPGQEVTEISSTHFPERDAVLRVRAVFHKTVRVCHVYCNFKIGFTCRITVIFGTLKDGSLLINTLASNTCFSYRNMFQNGVDFLSKSSKFYLVRIIR